MFFHQPVNFAFKPIQPIHDTVDVGVDFGFGNVLSGDFFAGFVNQHLKALYLIINALEKKPNYANANRKDRVPNSMFHLSTSMPAGFC